MDGRVLCGKDHNVCRVPFYGANYRPTLNPWVVAPVEGFAEGFRCPSGGGTGHVFRTAERKEKNDYHIGFEKASDGTIHASTCNHGYKCSR